MEPLTRRHFLAKTSIAGAALTIAPSLFAQNANKKIVAAVMGTNSRGMAHVKALLGQADVEIGYICDVDERAAAKATSFIANKQKKAPKLVKDFRRLLEDKDVDLLTIATPNHWHAPATILACSAGKHVYVEKPASHNAREGELMVAAARKNNRLVQMGNQRRSWPGIIEAVEKLHAGVIGEVRAARTWYNNARASIGRGK